MNFLQTTAFKPLWKPVFAGACCVLMASCQIAPAAVPDANAIAQITAAAPTKPAAKPAKARQVLVYTRANGFRHSSIETGGEALKILGQKTGAWTATVSDDPAMFDDLARFDAVVFLNTTGDALQPNKFNDLDEAGKTLARANETRYKANLLAFVNGGKGFCGIHAATDTMYGWAEYGQMIGGYFDGHPWGAGDDVSVKTEDASHPVVSHLGGKTLDFKEEIYQFRDPYNRKNQRVLQGLDLSRSQKKDNLKRTDGDYAVTWIKPQGTGRVFYCSLGHREDKYSDPNVLGIYLAGIQYAIGDLKADATPIAQEAPVYTDVALGEYGGRMDSASRTFSASALARVFPEGGDNYRAIVYWPTTTARNNDAMQGRRIELTGKREGDAIEFAGRDGEADVKARFTAAGTLTPGSVVAQKVGWFTLTQISPNMKLPGSQIGETVILQKLERKSPTLGQAAPTNAKVLLPMGKTTAELQRGPSLEAWTNQNWTALRDGSMQVKGGDQRSKAEFGDMKLHLEWMTPLMSEARGQGRGNSGVYLQDRYEVQVLDSFGLDSKDNDAGGIYQVAKPKVNAGLAPGQWNTYDITFRAPRLYTDGRQAQPAVVTVVLNGVTIQDNITLPGPTGGAASKDPVARGPIRLQDHGNPVRFRNIWVQELTDKPWTPIANPDPNAGRVALFDGKNFDAWAMAEGKALPAIEEGAMALRKTGDIWTKEQYGDFVLDLEYKVAPGGNSGVFIRNPKPSDWYAGMEIQVFDSANEEKLTVHSAGGNYDVLAPSKNASKPAGEWNTMQITAKGQNIQVVLNGERVLDQDLNQWSEAGKNPNGTNNKFKTAYKDMPKVGHIELQDHGQEVWYRNVRVQPLK